MVVPSISTPKWSFLVRKPMVAGYHHHFRVHPHINTGRGFFFISSSDLKGTFPPKSTQVTQIDFGDWITGSRIPGWVFSTTRRGLCCIWPWQVVKTPMDLPLWRRGCVGSLHHSMNHELEGKILQENFYVGHQQIAIMTLTPSISRENMMHFTQRIIGPFQKDAFFKTLH